MVCFPYSQKSEAQETRRPLQSLLILDRVKQCIPISGKCAVQDHAKDSTANEFADSDREHQKWERECYPISVAGDKRYDQRIREDRRQRQQERVLVPHPVYEDSSNQCCETAEDNIRQDRASEDVADQTPTKRPGTAAGVKAGRIVSASEMRTWISPKPNGAKSQVTMI